jgi:hypothetical protein
MNPNGIPSPSPGLRGPSYPGSRPRAGHNPNGVASFVARPSAATPLGLREILHRIPGVARASQPRAGCRRPVGANPIHPPGPRRRHAEFLKIDFPRLPLTGNLELFRALARLGGELTALHLLESPRLAQPITRFYGSDRQLVRIGETGKTLAALKNGTGRVPINATSGFEGVPQSVWDFHIGGYQVCHKWLDDRRKSGRSLSDGDIAHYHRIVVALSETIRLMAEIDQVIEQHGGWPLI